MAEELYLISRGGRGWYRPNAEGYTGDLSEVGFWTKDEAERYRDSAEGVHIHPCSEIKVDLELARIKLQKAINRIDATLATINRT